MKLVVIFGPQAVGKMTVGTELAKLTGLKLLHNHMTVDLVLNFFDWGTPGFRLSNEFRRRIFEEVSRSDLPGLIFTYVWDLDDPADKKYIDGVCAPFAERGAEIHFVELAASIEERLERNTSAFRLEQKPPKRDIERSRRMLLESAERHRLNSNGDFFHTENYVRIDNTCRSARETAGQIVSELGLAD